MDPLFHFTLRLFLAATLALPLAHKGFRPREFRRIVADYRVLPSFLTGPASAAILLLEAAAVGSLLTFPFVGGLLAAALFCLYGLAISVNLARGRHHIDCGCGWGGNRVLAPSARLTLWLPVRNAALASMALFVLAPVAQRPLDGADYGLIGVASVFFWMAWTALDQAVTQYLALSSLHSAERGSTHV
ncbi:MAG: hypothetical protein J4G09_05085 [Proteobacteria bacterium]|nr:hypothetical protein [Pseudomonadota bacterium]